MVKKVVEEKKLFPLGKILPAMITLVLEEILILCKFYGMRLIP